MPAPRARRARVRGKKANKKRIRVKTPVSDVEKVPVCQKWSKFAGYKMSCDPRRSLRTHPDAILFLRIFRKKSFSTSTPVINNYAVASGTLAYKGSSVRDKHATA
jgi:hypothetical protein